MATDHVRDHLQKLLGTLRDGEHGFTDAAEHATDPGLKGRLLARAQERATMATEITQHLTALGDTPQEHGSVGAALHRTWLNVRDALTGSDDHAVIAECARGEGVAVDNYQDVLNDTDLPAEVRGVVQAQLGRVQASKAELDSMG